MSSRVQIVSKRQDGLPDMVTHGPWSRLVTLQMTIHLTMIHPIHCRSLRFSLFTLFVLVPLKIESAKVYRIPRFRRETAREPDINMTKMTSARHSKRPNVSHSFLVSSYLLFILITFQTHTPCLNPFLQDPTKSVESLPLALH